MSLHVKSGLKVNNAFPLSKWVLKYFLFVDIYMYVHNTAPSWQCDIHVIQLYNIMVNSLKKKTLITTTL